MELVARFLSKNESKPPPRRDLAIKRDAAGLRAKKNLPPRASAYVNPRTIRAAQSLSIIAACLTAAISAVALTGWVFHIQPLKVQPALVALNPVIACCFILTSVSLLLLQRRSPGKTRTLLGQIAAGLVLAIGGFKVFSLVSGWDPGIDRWLFTAQVNELTDPSYLIAPKTAFCFVLGSSSLLFLAASSASVYRIAEILSTSVVAIGLFSLQGYAFGLLALHTAPGLVPMSMSTSINFLLLGTGVLLARVEKGTMSVIASDTPGGSLARRLLPLAIALPIVLGALRFQGERAGLYDTQFGAALFATAFTVLFLAAISWTARLLFRTDMERKLAELATRENEERVHQLNAELVERVAERTEALAAESAANKELEAFSYSVSHDLRAPLRAISGFSKIVIEDHSAALNADGLRYLQLVETSAQQMGQLIDDLLTFSRTGRQALRVQSVSTTDVVNAALTDLQAMQENRRVNITVGELPDCEADASLLRQVWLNLLSNALKYTRERDPAVITIGSRNDGRTDIYFVQDNGAGFDMKYADKLFGVFQRLHLADEFEGTGVGLALVQRIVQRHGGRVWTEAEVNRGATFYFTLTGGQSA
jgi:signal transduction histidine kinase